MTIHNKNAVKNRSIDKKSNADTNSNTNEKRNTGTDANTDIKRNTELSNKTNIDSNDDHSRNADKVQYYRTDMQKELILDKLKERGYRITNQRVMLIHIILEYDCASSKEIFYRATQQNANVGIATVYRMINTLEEIGAICRKNMYKINYNIETVHKKDCVIVYEDGSEEVLTPDYWMRVIQAGLEANGYTNYQKVHAVKMR